MSNNETLDLNFANVDAAEGGSNYLSPGIYSVKPTNVELVKKEGKTPYLKIAFVGVNDGAEGQIIEEKFFLSAKALPRLQYLHEKYLGFKLEKNFPSFEQLAEYFSQKLTVKPKVICVAVEGEEGSDGKIYARLPYASFIIEDTANVEEGAYPEDSPEYKKAIRKQRNASTNSSSAVLSGSATGSNAISDALPWEN